MPHRITAANAVTVHQWFVDRGGIAIWSSINLSNPGGSWTGPAKTAAGEPPQKPTWQAGDAPRIITDMSEVVVDEPREVARFHVAVRHGSQGMSLKVTDGSTRRINTAMKKAGPDAWYEFDYSTQEAVILVPDRSVPLPEWWAGHIAKKSVDTANAAR